MSCCFATAPTGSPTSQAWLELPLMPSTVAHVRALRQRLQAAARPTSVASSCAAGTTGCVTLLCCTTSRDLAFHGHPQSCSLSRTCRRQHGCRLLLPLESSCPRPGTVSHVTRADRPTCSQTDHTRTGHQFDPDKPSIVPFWHGLFHKPCPGEGFYTLSLSSPCFFST